MAICGFIAYSIALRLRVSQYLSVMMPPVSTMMVTVVSTVMVTVVIIVVAVVIIVPIVVSVPIVNIYRDYFGSCYRYCFYRYYFDRYVGPVIH